jgi:DNA-binding GntR family transcriptional regulator
MAQSPEVTSAPKRLGAGPGQFESAYQRLKQAIIAGVYAPRQHLVEADLARDLCVSRATVRAVLIRLQQDGLVEIQPNRGARVRVFSFDEVTKVLEVREALEGLAASIAAAKISPQQLAELHAILDKMETVVTTGDVLAFRELNTRFHQIIIDAADNSFIAQILGSFNYPLIRWQLTTILVPGRNKESVAEHRAILACLERRDSQGAEEQMRQHVAHVRMTLQRCGLLPL